MFDASLLQNAVLVLEASRQARCRITTAESCTGGLLAGLLTHLPGSSEVFERGFVTYSNEAKIELLGVPKLLIDHFGAVSAEVALAMAEGALAHSRAELALSVTGIAGPGGGSAGKPVGLVFLGCQWRGCDPVISRQTFGVIGREQVRAATLAVALDLLLAALNQAMPRP